MRLLGIVQREVYEGTLLQVKMGVSFSELVELEFEFYKDGEKIHNYPRLKIGVFSGMEEVKEAFRALKSVTDNGMLYEYMGIEYDTVLPYVGCVRLNQPTFDNPA